jgi:hypothetical protein
MVNNLYTLIDPAEIFPFRTRAKGMALAVSSNWVSHKYIYKSKDALFINMNV